MKLYKRAFSIVELVLILGILGLIAAVFIPATAKIREKARNDIIISNLQKFVNAGGLYLKDRGLKNVSYKTLVSSKTLEPLTSVCGEKYDDLVYSTNEKTVEVETPSGGKVVLTY